MAEGRARGMAFSEKNRSNNRLKEMNIAALGYILVWDLDDTLSHFKDEDEYESDPTIFLNPKAIEILKLAVKARKEGRVAAILLLTNNSDLDYISYVKNLIDKNVGQIVFNDMLYALSPGRNVPKGYAPNYATKSLADVSRMLQNLKLPLNSFWNRTFFFDDQRHNLSRELAMNGKADNYIQITPPFAPGQEDKTNWSRVEAILQGRNVEGGGRAKTKKIYRKEKSKTKKNRKH